MAEETAARPKRPARPPKWTVRRVDLNQPDHAGSNIVQFDSEGPARNHIMNNYPRGREVFLQAPDGSRQHYSADHDFQGDDPWQDFSEDEEVN